MPIPRPSPAPSISSGTEWRLDDRTSGLQCGCRREPIARQNRRRSRRGRNPAEHGRTTAHASLARTRRILQDRPIRRQGDSPGIPRRSGRCPVTEQTPLGQNRSPRARTARAFDHRLDNSVANSRRRIENLEAELERLWKTQKPVIAGRLSRDSGEWAQRHGTYRRNRPARALSQGVRALRSPGASRHQSNRQTPSGARAARRGSRTVACAGRPHRRRITQVRALEESLDLERRGRSQTEPSARFHRTQPRIRGEHAHRSPENFEEDLIASKSTEISQLAENNLRE